MKLKPILALAAGIAFAAQAQAQTYIEITGATAFRQAATNAINSAFASQGAFGVSFNGASFTGATFQAWKGTFPGIGGTTVIRTSWNGSVEGVRAIGEPGVANNPAYLLESSIPVPAVGPTPLSVSTASNTENLVSEMAFSDVAQSSTPVNATLAGGPVGVVVFTMIANKTWRDDSAGDTAGLTNVSNQQFRALAANGFQPLSLFSGNAAHTNKVYLTGRNDGSGTRSTYLAETGVGIANPIKQYVVHDRTTATIEKILLTAKGGGFNFQNTATQSGSAQYQSTVWSNDLDGNGGYSSGSFLTADLAKTSTAAAVWAFEDLDESGTYDATEDSQVVTAAKIYLLSWVSGADARTARGNNAPATANAQVLGYQGVRLDDLENTSGTLTTFSTADRAKVANGNYTAWGYEQFLYVTGNATLTGVFNTIKSGLTSSALGLNGIPITEMNVSRNFDGGTVAP